MVAYFEGRLRRGELTPESLGRQRGMVRNFVVSYGARPSNQFSVKAVDRWLETIADLSPGSRRGRIGVVRRFCAYLHAEWDYPDVTRAFPRVRVPRTVPRSIPHGEVVKIFAQATEKRDRAILALIFYQAMRVGEVTKLRVEDYDGESLFVRGKGGHERMLPVGEHCQRALDDWLRERGTVPGAMFPGERAGEGLRPNTLSHYVSEWMWNCGVKKRSRDGRTAHAGRHTAATRAARSGVSVWGIQELLGHSSPSTSAIYTRGAGSAELRQAVEADYQTSG
jgi:integrase